MRPAFARVLSQAVERRSLTVPQVVAALRAEGHPVSAPTLRSWMTGATVPSRRSTVRALIGLESILGLEAGALTALTPAAAVLAEGRQRGFFGDLDDVWSSWGRRRGIAVESSCVTSTLDLTEPGAPVLRHAVVGIAARGAVDRLALLLDARAIGASGAPGATGPSVTRRALQILGALPEQRSGMRLGRCGIAGDDVALCEAILPAPLDRGAAVSIELTVSGLAPRRPSEAVMLRAFTPAPAVALIAQIAWAPEVARGTERIVETDLVSGERVELAPREMHGSLSQHVVAEPAARLIELESAPEAIVRRGS